MNHLREGEDSQNHKTAIVVFDERIPSPDRDAGSARMSIILQTLAQENDVVFLPFNRPHGIEYEKALWEIGIETGDIVDYRKFFERRNFAVAILSRPAIAEAMLKRVRRADRKTKVIYDMLDVHHLRATRAAALTGDPRDLREAEKLRGLETRLGRAADLIWCGSSPDQELMANIASGVPSVVVPTIHNLHERGQSFQERKDLLFVGAFGHRPNVDAVHFMGREVMPLIRKSLPGVELLVAGSSAPSDFAAYASNGVRVLGFVPDLDPIVSGSRVFVAPIRFGSGVNGKIGEALSYGLPVVTTTIGAEGWNFTDGKQVLIANSPTDFAAAVVRLYQTPDLWKELSDAGYCHIAENFTPEVLGDVIKGSVRTLVNPQTG
ncbi:MAG TPA: glycosyltransferase [Pyrinomonadaceae bacterium]|nr:glycosyltransferase [Pyrinomonadaceae bacterium]